MPSGHQAGIEGNITSAADGALRAANLHNHMENRADIRECLFLFIALKSMNAFGTKVMVCFRFVC